MELLATITKTERRAMDDLKVDCFNQAEAGKRGAGRWYMRLPEGD